MVDLDLGGRGLSKNEKRVAKYLYNFLVVWLGSTVLLYLYYLIFQPKDDYLEAGDFGPTALILYLVVLVLYATGILFLPFGRMGAFWIYAVGSGYVPALISALFWPLTLPSTAGILIGY